MSFEAPRFDYSQLPFAELSKSIENGGWVDFTDLERTDTKQIVRKTFPYSPYNPSLHVAELVANAENGITVERITSQQEDRTIDMVAIRATYTGWNILQAVSERLRTQRSFNELLKATTPHTSTAADRIGWSSEKQQKLSRLHEHIKLTANGQESPCESEIPSPEEMRQYVQEEIDLLNSKKQQ